MRECYVDHFDVVFQSVGRILHGADQETVVHEVFFRIITDDKMRRNFKGGSLRAWLSTVAKNRAVDFWRKYCREQNEEPKDMDMFQVQGTSEFMDRTDVRITLERFNDECLSEKLRSVFKARFVQGLNQREAADTLGMLRTTLAYQERQIKRKLRRFLKGAQGS